jgi:hypothetical protein
MQHLLIMGLRPNANRYKLRPVARPESPVC